MVGIKIDRRAMAKTLTWRILATATTILVALLLTGSIGISLGIGTIEVILKTVFYYIHEKIWDRVGLVTEKEL